MSDFKFESMLTRSGSVAAQLTFEGRVVGMAAFHLDVAAEFLNAIDILRDKMSAAGLVGSAFEVVEVPPKAAFS